MHVNPGGQAPGGAAGPGAPQAIGILALLIVLLAFDLVSPAMAAAICATLMVVTRVVTLPQVFRGIDSNTCLLIAAMIPPAVAMTKTGAAAPIGDQVVTAVGGMGPYAVLAGGLPGVGADHPVHLQHLDGADHDADRAGHGDRVGRERHRDDDRRGDGCASAWFLTPFANGVSLFVFGPGGYKFGDYWKLGLIVLAWTFAVTVVVIPVSWSF